MDNLKQELQNALKDAMKNKDKERRDVIRLVQSAVKQVEIDEQTELDNDAVEQILQKEAKKRRETIAELEAAGRGDDAASETFELSVIEEFLPKQLTADELKPIVQAAIEETGATSMKQMGDIMKVVMPQVQGRADGRQVNAVVKELLG
jgi:uncharacterized protein YqeY